MDNNKYLGNYIKKGKGPGEIVIPWSISKINENSFLIYDVVKRSIIGFHLDSLNNDNCLFESKFQEKEVCASVHLIKNDIYHTNYLNSNFRIFKSDTINKEEKGFGSLLNNYKNSPDINFAQACRAYLAYGNSKFISAYHFAPFFEIFNEGNNKWKSIMAIDTNPLIYNDVMVGGNSNFEITEETKIGFIDICTTNNYIYLLYSGENFKNNQIDSANKVLVFDFEGNPKMLYTLDRNISSFEVYNDQFIYGLNLNVEAELLKFHIK